MIAGFMSKADGAVVSAKLLLDAEDSGGATNRTYYAMFDAASAALAWAGAPSTQDRHRTHGGLIRRFGAHLVRTGRLDAEFGRSLNRVQELRLTGDYLAEPVPLERASWAVQEADAFVSAVRQLLTADPSGTGTDRSE
jgi:uncharacterized protein (UPF0332 family)